MDSEKNSLRGAARRFLREQRVARLATIRPDGQPHIVPICFAFDGRVLFTPIDEKPKRAAPTRLQRLKNIRANPRVAVLVDRYSEDWTKLAWVRVDGRARALHRGREHARAIELLRAKYPQYREMDLETRPIIQVTITRVTSWGDL